MQMELNYFSPTQIILIMFSISFLVCIIIARIIIRRVAKDDMLYRERTPKIDRTTHNVTATIINVTDMKDQGIVGPTGVKGSFGITGATGIRGSTGYSNISSTTTS